MEKMINHLHHIPAYQEYLEQIFRITVNNDNLGVTNSVLAKKLKISPSSAYEMLKKLEEKKFLYKKKKYYFLTEKGEEIALLIVSNNVVLKIFLSKVLKFTDEELL